MPDLENGKPCTIKIKNGPAGFFKNLFGKNAGAAIEIIYH
jgi:hypothetical protein